MRARRAVAPKARRAIAAFTVFLAAAPVALAQDSPIGLWAGRYNCAQGETGLVLDIQRAPDWSLRALFYFHPLPNNLDDSQGCFEMSGDGTDPVALTLFAGRWVLKPDNYVTVNLLGRFNEGVFSGQVDGPGCTTFTLRRAGGDVHARPAACAGFQVSSR